VDFGDAVEEVINDANANSSIKLKKFGYPDEFVKHGGVSEIERKYGLDANSVANEVENIFFEVLENIK